MLYYGLKKLTAPQLAVSNAELKSHFRLVDDDVQLLEVQAKARYATEYIEEQTAHVAMPTTYRVTFSRFPFTNRRPYQGPLWAAIGHILLPRSPVISVTTFQYVDADGVTQTLTSDQYQLATDYEPARLSPVRLQVWPWNDPYTIDSVKITFVAGYANEDLVPERYKEAIKFIAAHRFFNREDDEGIPDTLRMLVRNLKIGWEG